MSALTSSGSRAGKTLPGILFISLYLCYTLHISDLCAGVVVYVGVIVYVCVWGGEICIGASPDLKLFELIPRNHLEYCISVTEVCGFSGKYFDESQEADEGFLEEKILDLKDKGIG